MERDLTAALFYVLLARDRVTAIHSRNVARFAITLGDALGLSPGEIRELSISALLHDCGKIGLPDRLLKTARKYTRWEKETIKQHVVIGKNLVASLGFSKAIVEGVYYHHERYDGMGYVRGLAGSQIPLFGRIIAIADTFDALIGKRPYRDPLPVHKAVEVMKNSEGQFDPELLKYFLHKIVSIYKLNMVGI